MATYLDFITVAEFHTYMDSDLPDTDTQWDEWIERAIGAFSVKAERYCNRYFLKKARTLVFDGDGKSMLRILHAIPVDSITSIKTHSTGDFSSVTALDTTHYAVDSETGILRRRDAAWVDGVQNVQVVYTGGLGTVPEDVPDDLKQAAFEQINFWWRRREKPGIQSEGFQGGSQTVFSTKPLLPSVQDALDGYRIPA